MSSSSRSGGGGLVSGMAVVLDGLGARQPRSWGCSRPGPRPWCARSRRDIRSPSTSRTTSSTAPWCARRDELTFAIVRDLVSSTRGGRAEGRVCTEQLDLYQVDGIVAEPAGALAIAALDALAARHRGQDRGVRVERRQQRRGPLRRDHRALPGVPGPQALLHRGLPPAPRGAAPVPRRVPGPHRRHRAVRVHQEERPGVRARRGRGASWPSATTSGPCWGASPPRVSTSSCCRPTARCSVSSSEPDAARRVRGSGPSWAAPRATPGARRRDG